MLDQIEKIFNESIEVKKTALQDNKEKIVSVVEAIVAAFNNGNKILFFGNGGSAADSQHIAAEFIGRFMKERKSLPAIALTTDTSILTAIGNDYGYDKVFARQIEGIAKPGDVAFGISTSGNSPNVLKGLEQAKSMGLKTVSLTGKDGGSIAKATDISMIVSSQMTARIQESHLCIAHTICELVENNFEEK